MYVRLFTILALILSFSVLAKPGRAPAVEDFVGIEVDDHVETTPRGAGSLYNLESDMQKVKLSSAGPLPSDAIQSSEEGFSWSTTTYAAVGIFALLPLIICGFVMNNLRKKASIESASNIEVLEKYRKEREARKNQEIKKAS
jgi:hypothetical protein